MSEINLQNYLPSNILQKLTRFDLSFHLDRMIIWKNSLLFIFQKPFFGWGSGTFNNIFQAKSNILVPLRAIQPQHTHNLFLELAYNFGIPASLIFGTIIFSIYKKAFMRLNYFKKSITNFYINKSWIASFTVFLSAHLTDITYYDGKISILFAILFAGLINISKDNEINDKGFINKN